MKSVLSTKKLTPSQKKLFQDTAIDLVDYDAVEIKNIDFDLPKSIHNAIFTSQNAVDSFFKKYSRTENNLEVKCFCVGQKTSTLLEKNGLKVVKSANKASELANFIVKNHNSEPFFFFCGNKRRDEIPFALKKAKIAIFEVKTYKTELKKKKFNEKWEEILFFSPSGVESFIAKNSFGSSTAICIGTTTASEAKKHTESVVIAEETTIESVIKKLLNI